MSDTIVAFSVLDQRIAPVFDTSSEIVVIEIDGKEEVKSERLALTQNNVFELIEKLSALNLNQLICGAISRALQRFIEQKGIQVVPFVAGDLDTIKQAWTANKLDSEEYIMPGCCGRRLRGGHGRAAGAGRQRGCGIAGRHAGLGHGCGTGAGITRQVKGLGLGFGRGLGVDLENKSGDSDKNNQ